MPVRGGVTLDQANTAVPAQDGFVISCRSNFFRAFVAAHRFFQQDHQSVWRTSGAELRLGAALVEKSQIVEPLVGVGELLKSSLHFGIAVGRRARKLIGNREAQ